MTHSTIKAHYDENGNYLYFVYGYRTGAKTPTRTKKTKGIFSGIKGLITFLFSLTF